jgi:hypothetical protein
MEKKIFTLKEAREITGYSIRFLQQICKQREHDDIGIKRFGPIWIVSDSFINEYLPTLKRGRPRKSKEKEGKQCQKAR